MTNLTAERVETLFLQCMRANGKDVAGIVTRTTLDTAGHEAEIAAMLADLPDEFQSSSGGGWSFLNACHTKAGVQWTDLHSTMEKLFMLGIASGQAQYLMPRELWSALPGGMPYIVVKPIKGHAQ